MSKEFEEIVLKKLDVLDERTKNTDKVIEEVILKQLDKLDILEADMTIMKNDMCSLKTEVKSINQRLDNQEKELKSTQSELKSTQLELKSMQEIVKNLNDNFTVFDFEINKKIDTIFDAITANNEKHDIFEKSIVSLNTKTFNHDIRISVLEDYNKDAKLFATS